MLAVEVLLEHALMAGHRRLDRDSEHIRGRTTTRMPKPHPTVIDFGIAKAIQGRLTDAMLFTMYDQIIGTPAYMSPEQADIGGLDIDTRSAVYSLGVVLYELLAGRCPCIRDHLALQTATS